jgi:hypothetical protein
LDDLLIPDIESDIPLPRNAADALPDLTPAQELEMRAATIKLLADISGKPIKPDQENIEEANMLAKAMTGDPKLRPVLSRYPNETLAYLAGMVQSMNCQIVDELSEIKTYVLNKLIMEADNAPDSKTRIMALRNLGEIDGVDAFKKRTEMTIKVKPIEEVEKELLSIIENVEYRVLETKNVSPPALGQTELRRNGVAEQVPAPEQAQGSQV